MQSTTIPANDPGQQWSVSLDIQDRTVTSRLLARARKEPDRPAYWTKRAGRWEPTTWGRFADDVLAFANGMIDLGLPIEGAITVLSFNRIEWMVALLAAQAAGALCGGIYDTCAPDEVGYINRHCNATFAVVEDLGQWEKVKASWREGDALKAAIVVNPEGVPLGGDGGLETLSFESVVERGRRISRAPLEERLHSLRPDSTASLIYTSGTTGNPKGVVLTHANVLTATKIAYEALDGTPDFIVLSYLPLSHIAEQLISVYGPVIYGFTAYFAESRDAVPENLKEVRPSFFLGVPRVWEKFYAKIRMELDRAKGPKAATLFLARRAASRASHYVRTSSPMPPLLRLQYALARVAVFDRIKRKVGFDRCGVFASGAAPISAEILELFASLDINIREVYGMTEVGGICTGNLNGAIRFGSVGIPLEPLEVKTAEDGEILVRGDAVFTGYLNDEAATTDAFTDDGWLKTGDVGRFDEDGFLFVTDRKKEIIITSGGKNVCPQLIEGKMKNLPLVSHAVVVGDGQKYLAALVTLDREAALAHLDTRGDVPDDATPETLALHPVIRDEIERGLADVNRSLARVEQIKRFEILPNEFSHDTGELTPTFKLKRRVVEKKYAPLIDQLFAG